MVQTSKKAICFNNCHKFNFYHLWDFYGHFNVKSPLYTLLMYILMILLEIYINSVYDERFTYPDMHIWRWPKTGKREPSFGHTCKQLRNSVYINGYFADVFLDIKRFSHIYLINNRWINLDPCKSEMIIIPYSYI